MLYLAFRQMLSRKKQTLLIFLGVSFGTMIYIVIAGLQFGFRSYLYEQLLNNTSHVLITGKEGDIVEKEITPRFFGENEFVRWLIPPQGKRSESKLENPQSWFDRLSDDPEVIAYAPKTKYKWNGHKIPTPHQCQYHWNHSLTSGEDYFT